MEPRDREIETKGKTLHKLEDGVRRCETSTSYFSPRWKSHIAKAVCRLSAQQKHVPPLSAHFPSYYTNEPKIAFFRRSLLPEETN